MSVHLDGVLSYVKNLTLHHDGLLSLNENSRTSNEHKENDFKFDFITVQYKGLLRMISNPATHSGMNLTVKLLHVEGGGRVESSDLQVLAENISINTDGLFTLNGRGYSFDHGTSTGINGKINKGRGSFINSGSVYNGASGGGYGGTGGRGKTSPIVGLPYGNLYEPWEFGSSGGKGSGTAGKLTMPTLIFHISLYMLIVRINIVWTKHKIKSKNLQFDLSERFVNNYFLNSFKIFHVMC